MFTMNHTLCTKFQLTAMFPVRMWLTKYGANAFAFIHSVFLASLHSHRGSGGLHACDKACVWVALRRF